MRRLLLHIILICSQPLLFAQQNIVPNGSFEEYLIDPTGWNNNGTDFTKILSAWNSPNQASPDVYGPYTVVPEFWKDKGFGFIHPKDGKSCVGLTLFGCEKGKPHCREYIQVKLDEALVPGQAYEFSMQLSPLSKGLRINGLGAVFLYDSIQKKYDFPLKIKPTLAAKKIIRPRIGRWKKLTFNFNAKARERYLLIGNFLTDDQTLKHKDNIFTKLPYAYYYVDDIILKKIPPIIKYENTNQPFTASELEIKKINVLENIYFDYEKATLLPKSYYTLSLLLELLINNPEMWVKIYGHTDSKGSSIYNQDLSERRAKAVYDYLIDKGISVSRLAFQGFGESVPQENNSSVKGRQMNRRVEFVVVKK